MPQFLSRFRGAFCLLACTLAAAACDSPSGPEVREPPLAPPEARANNIVMTIGYYTTITPGGGNPQNAYVTVPNTETISTVATATIASSAVRVECKTPGNAWVKVLTGNGYWKIYSLACIDRFEGDLDAMVGETIGFGVAGGTPQHAYVSTPEIEDSSSVAVAAVAGAGVEVTCRQAGYGWVKVLTGNGYWKIYSLTCRQLMLEARIQMSTSESHTITVLEGPTGVTVTEAYRQTVSIVVEARIYLSPSQARAASGSASPAADVAATGGAGVSVTCKAAGSAWVRVQVSDGTTKVFPVTCEPLRPESTVTGYLGESVYIPVPGGSPQSVYVTMPQGETISDVASFAVDGSGVRGHCNRVGDAWVRVVTGTGSWKIYPLACRWRHDQGGAG